MKRILLCLLLALVGGQHLLAQADDAVLFSVGDVPVTVGEFRYIYTKNNGNKADFSRSSVEEYLELYKTFKMKVAHARALGLDQDPERERELKGYYDQLANSYLIDREVKDQLVREVYERQGEDVRFSHILVQVKPGASPADTLQAYRQLADLKAELAKGADFDDLARRFSQDPYAKDNGGDLGYVTAMLPAGFYELETAIYGTPVGGVAGPVKSRLGYHLVKVTDKRPARGRMEAAHILIRGTEAEAEARIRKAYERLREGEDFGLLARELSEDNTSGPRGGSLGIFGINNFEAGFEAVAFGLEADGDFSEPFLSSVGWHIVKRISKPEPQPYNIERSRLAPLVERDPRFLGLRDALIQRIRKDNAFRVNTTEKEALYASLDSSFYTYRWAPTQAQLSDAVLFNFGESYSVSVRAFSEYLVRNARLRSRSGTSVPIRELAEELFAQFVDEQTLEFEKGKLPGRYPEFKALMREYEEGILLFEISKQMVWEKAPADSVGLAAFFAANQSRYMWPERARVTRYEVATESSKVVDKVRKYARKKDAEKVASKFNKEDSAFVLSEGSIVERAELLAMGLEYKKGHVGPASAENGISTFYKVEALLPVGPKTLDEARGLAITDYQDELERNWVQDLRTQYSATVNDDILNQLIR